MRIQVPDPRPSADGIPASAPVAIASAPPWTPQAQHLSDIEIAPSVATGMVVEYMAVHNFANIYPEHADS